MSKTKTAMKFAIEDAKLRFSSKRKKRQVYKVVLSDVLDDLGNCFISELYEKEHSGWKDIEAGGYVLSDDAKDVFKFFNQYGIDLNVKTWSDILNKEVLILL